MVWGREGGKEGYVCGEQYRLEGCGSLGARQLEPRGDNVDQPSRVSPCDADCSWVLRKSRRLRTKRLPSGASGRLRAYLL